MKSKENNFTLSFTKRLIDNLGEEKNNFTVVKHYGTYNITSEEVKDVMISAGDVSVFYHNFDSSQMVETFEPFLGIIKNFYSKYYSNLAVDEFLGEFDIYPVQKQIFKTYIESGNCYRNETYILDEIDYEKKRMVESVSNTIVAISKKCPILVMINNLNAAPKSTIQLLIDLLNRNDTENIAIFAAYNDIYAILPFMSEEWEMMLEMLNANNCVYEGGVYKNNYEAESAQFVFNKNNVYEYIMKISSMYYTVDFEQAKYYLSIIYNKLENEKTNLTFEEKFELYRLYTMTLIFSDDIQQALLLCDKIKFMNESNPADVGLYEYYYLLTYAKMYCDKIDDSIESALKCLKISEKLNDDFKKFKAEMLVQIAKMSGWHKIFFFETDMEVSEEFIEKSERYGFFNHLAHIYIYAYNNNIENFLDIKCKEDIAEKLPVFQEGIDLANNLGNKELVLLGYSKNNMLTSTHGMFEIANYCNLIALDIMGDANDDNYAGLCNGIGYVNCTMYNFKKSNEYYNKAIHIFMEDGEKVDYIGETLYNMSINCILAGDNENAYRLLLAVVKIIETLNLNSLRVCNIAKIFGLLALASINLGLEYNCMIYLDTVRRFLNYYLEETDENIRSRARTFLGNDDELFLYHFTNGLMKFRNGEYREAERFYSQAQVHSDTSTGNRFFSVIQLRLAKADLYEVLNRRDKKEEELKIALMFAKNAKYKQYVKYLNALVRGEAAERPKYKLGLTGLSFNDINEEIKRAGVMKQYNDIQENMDFLPIWQNIIDINGKEKMDIIEDAANAFMLNFNLDAFTYIKFDDKSGEVVYTNYAEGYSETDIEILKDYFEDKRVGFVTSKIRKNYRDYSKVLNIYGKDYVCSIVCNPYFVNEKLDALFISCIFIKENWNIKSAKYLLDESELRLFDMALRQLISAIEKVENIERINRINDKLQKSSITDYLTGLKNRAGFYEKVTRRIEKVRDINEKLSIAILYIDLDNFKYYNDTFGHDVGDLILKEIAAILNEIAGKHGFATRYGGDEFIITLFDCDVDEAMATARLTLDTILSKNGYINQISSFLGKRVEIAKGKAVACSIGVAYSEQISNDEELTNLINNADDTLYSIKHTTKNDIKLYVH